MACPERLTVNPTEVTNEKCRDNYEFWQVRLGENEVGDIRQVEVLSENVLPCHTLAYENLEKIFFAEEDMENSGLLSLDKRHAKNGTVPDPNNSPFMKGSIELGHHIFVYAYHGVHNPYHRKYDTIPIRPVGLFFKKDIEIFSCVHGSPCDVSTTKNEWLKANFDIGLDKFYLTPEHLRSLKPRQIFSDPYLRNSFWYYFGNPIDWGKEKNYGKKLFERAGEFRYLDAVPPNDIQAILWPVWKDNDEIMEKNINLFCRFREKYPSIERIQYNLDKYNAKWSLALVEASYYTQRYFIEFNAFENDADIAKRKIEEKYGISNNTHN